MANRALRLLHGIALTAIAGCNNESPTPGREVVEPPPDTGVLRVFTTVAGHTNPSACRAWKASDLEIIVYDGSGREYADAYAPCDDFTLDVELPEGGYTADAALVSRSMRPVSVTIPLDRIEVHRGKTTTIGVDFPAQAKL